MMGYLFTCLIFLITFFVQAAEMDQMRGKRYCEIIIAKKLENYQVFNTWGLNDCPEKIWKNIDEKQVKKETGARFVHLNGPRYWTFDGFKKTDLINPEVKTIDGLSLREAGVLHLSLLSILTSKPYQRHEVARHTTWIYQEGKPVYELISPDGEVFVMQSYSVQYNAQTLQSLSELGSKLTLPKGWRFKTGILQQSEELPAVNNIATVIQDNFSNTYQKSVKDYLK